MELVTQRLKLYDINKEAANTFAEQLGVKAEEVEFVRKGIVPNDVQFDEGEHAAVSYITTRDIDRDGEIVEPSGADLEAYRKNPVVLFGHNYSDLPIGKNIWIKQDDRGLIAKTVYANHDFAQTVYNYRKDGFPLAQSIGFIPIEWEDNPQEGGKALKGCRRRYHKWALLEYSDVPVPANPEAVAIAVSKGLIKAHYELIEDKAGRVLSAKNRTLIMAAVQQMDEAGLALRDLLEATEPDEPAEVPSGETIEMVMTASHTIQAAVVDEKPNEGSTEKDSSREGQAIEQTKSEMQQAPHLEPIADETFTKADLIMALQGAIKQNRVDIAGIIEETVARRLGRVTLD